MPKKIVTFFMFLLCSFMLHATPYTIGNPLIVGADDGPITGDKDFQDMILKMFGDFTVISLCGTGQNACSTNGGWQGMVPPDQNGAPYWDGNSSDSTMSMNVGDYVLGTGGFAGNPSSPNWTVGQTQYWGTPSGGAAGFGFRPNSGNVQTTMTVEISALANINYLAYAYVSAPNTQYTIFSGPESPGSSATFTPTENFFFVFSNGNTNFASNGNVQAFALFQQGSADVPEPITFALMGAGLCAIALIRRRQQKN